jgi:predicted DNA-binding transcriptional regulator
MSELTQQTKSFWARPEGKTGMLAIAAGMGGLWFAGPFLIGLFATAITLVGQAITLTILGAILFALWMIISNKKFQTLVSYAFKSAMRAITGVIVEIDPIGIMKSYVEDMKKKRETIGEARDKLNGQIKNLEQKIRDNDQNMATAISKAKVAKDKGMGAQLQVQARQAGRLEKLNEGSFRPMLAKMAAHKKALDKYFEVTGIVIEDLQNEVDMREIQRKTILASHTAMKAAAAIINGGTSEKELFDQATEFVALDYAAKLGEIESFIENSQGFVDGIDIENGVYEATALAKLEEWEGADSILLGHGKAALIQQDLSHSPLTTKIGADALDYTNLLSRK